LLVDPDRPAVSLHVSSSRVSFGHPITLTAQVSDQTSRLAPTGQVRFFTGTVPSETRLGTVSLDSSGVAQADHVRASLRGWGSRSPPTISAIRTTTAASPEPATVDVQATPPVVTLSADATSPAYGVPVALHRPGDG